MNQMEKPEQFDIDALRRKVSESGDADPTSAPATGEEAEINPLAKQIATQFSEENYSPSIITGQLRLLELVSLFAIGLAVHYFLFNDPS